MGVQGATIGLNSASCRPAARRDDSVINGQIATGSATVCIGGP